jgi:hypothetical protein
VVGELGALFPTEFWASQKDKRMKKRELLIRLSGVKSAKKNTFRVSIKYSIFNKFD